MSTVSLLGGIGHVVGGIVFVATALWTFARPSGGMPPVGFALAALATLLWSAGIVAQGDDALLVHALEGLRNIAWLAVMLLLVRGGAGGRARSSRSIVPVYVVIAVVALLKALLALLAPLIVDGPQLGQAFTLASNMLGMTFTVGALLLVHNLYTACAAEARWGIRLPSVALALMWMFDLNLYTIAYLTGEQHMLFHVARGLLMIPVAVLIALGSRRNARWQMQPSRSVAFQTLSLIAIGGYMVLMMLVVRALHVAGIENLLAVQLTAIVVMSAVGGVLLPSRRLRAWARETLVRHLFKHRYDYRVEWLRFTETLGRPGPDAAPLDVRVIKAIADITESPGGVLLVPDAGGGLVEAARWSWPALDVPARAGEAAFVRRVEEKGAIIELDALRRSGDAPEIDGAVPEWMLATGRGWAVVPLLHFDRLVGLVMLERPFIDRTLDWEDVDLLRLAGRQVASYLAEASGQEALLEARRFDEFNRRFAFMMHDIKNLVSQLTLVARNAERHADNPAFRADMVATLRNSADRMSDLLARLSGHGPLKHDEPRTVSLRAIADGVAAQRRGAHQLRVDGRADVLATADPARLEQAVTHLVQNAIEASPRGQPVTIAVSRRDDEAVLSVIDKGLGMTAEFIRNGLFRPFASTKEKGFGIGAYEARVLIAGMGGRLEVWSRPGKGTRFDILLAIPADTGRAEPHKRQAS